MNNELAFQILNEARRMLPPQWVEGFIRTLRECSEASAEDAPMLAAAGITPGESRRSVRVSSASPQESSVQEALEHSAGLNVGPKASLWVRQQSLTINMLDEVFHLANDFEIIAHQVAGSTKKERTGNCYLLCGIRALLRTDTTAFDDGDAVRLCKRLGAYDKNNHPANRKALGNRMIKEQSSLMLTGPGQTAAAQLIKNMSRARTSS